MIGQFRWHLGGIAGVYNRCTVAMDEFPQQTNAGRASASEHKNFVAWHDRGLENEMFKASLLSWPNRPLYIMMIISLVSY